MRKIGIIGLLGVMVGMSVSCQQEKVFMKGSFSNLGEDTVYVKMVFPALEDSVAYDTLLVNQGKFTSYREISTPVEVEMEFGCDRVMQRGRWQTPVTQKMMFYIEPGESVTLRGNYHPDFLDYTLEGSETLSNQSEQRSAMKDYMKRIRGLIEARSQALSGGIENADEAYVDSLYAEQISLTNEMAMPRLGYVTDHPDRNLSAYFLLRYPDRDSFLSYYEKLDSSVRNGVWKYRLNHTLEAAQRMEIIRANAEKLSPGAMAPDFILFDMDGNEIRLSDYMNRYVVLDFWGTWCPWCVKGFPKMKEYYEKVKSKVVFLGIACRDQKEKVVRMINSEHLDWINVMNGFGEKDVALLYGVSGYPTKILLEPGLKVKQRYLGETPAFYNDLDVIASK